MMEEKNYDKLKAAIGQLPQYEPDPQQWNKIEASLDFDKHLQQLLPEMPMHEPKGSLWDAIENQLEPVKETRHFQLATFFRFASAAAASILLLLVGIYLLNMYPQEKVKLTYSEEVVLQEPENPEISQEHNEALQFIQAQCGQLPEICQKPEFKELQQELAKLEEENKKLEQQIAVFGEDPVLIRNQIKIENLRAEFTKKLIQIIIS